MVPIKIPKFPLQAYEIVSHGSSIEVFEVEITGYEEAPPAWVHKVTKVIWQMIPREVNDSNTYRSSDFENFCFDLYSVKMKVESFQKEMLDKANKNLELVQHDMSQLLKKITELDNNSQSIRKNIQTLETIKFPDIRSLYEKL